ncbi:MAG TPA: hypothetical protein VJQ47_10960, partial [Steroidobacteraceae bacterium]|nr:hypothetical protein [Steroidobacteraceae bacterium]
MKRFAFEIVTMFVGACFGLKQLLGNPLCLDGSSAHGRVCEREDLSTMRVQFFTTVLRLKIGIAER